MFSQLFHIAPNFRNVKWRLLVLMMLFSTFSFSQEKKRVEILRAGSLEANERIAANAQRLIDSVLISHKNILMWCDSAYTYTGTNRVDAFGRVHIKQDDTLHLYANKVFYDGDKSFARAWGNVKLINKSTTIYTDTLDYDLAANISYYDDNGKIVDSTTTITSVIGKYFINDDLLNLYMQVVATNDDFTMYSDTVSYNTVSKRIFITGPTTIRDSANTLYAENGWYDSNTGEAELLKKPVISNETQKIAAKYIRYSKENKKGKALGSVRITDQENNSIILGNIAEYDDALETAMVTDSAVYMTYDKNDTLYLHADTLRTMPDTIPDEKIVFAYKKVRFFRTDLQGICDSMVYFTRDSIIQLHQFPVIWSEIHQLSADLIEMRQFQNAPDELHLSKNSFIISKQDSNMYDQIKGKEMVGYLVNNELRNIEVDGNGQTLYYAREKDEIIGLNRAESSKISIRFREDKIYTISFLKAPEGELKPLFELAEEDKKLKGFEWKIFLRPLSKYDIFERLSGREKEELMMEEILKKTNILEQ
ncbi:MAG TPA: OstA-like protein [Draconibacterium sp.]|nr:OstA-like protein [Draconibacterium sp.]